MRYLLGALAALTAVACTDAPTDVERSRSPGDFIRGVAPAVFGPEDTLTYVFGRDGKKSMDVRHNSTWLARGVALDWKPGDPVTRSANLQNYWEESGDEPNFGWPSQPSVPSQQQTCYERAKYWSGQEFKHDAEQVLKWTDTDQRQPRLELVRAKFTAWFGWYWASNAPGVPDYACVLIDSARVIRTAYQYMELTTERPDILFGNTFDYCSGTNCNPSGAGWPLVEVETRMYFQRQCNYYASGWHIEYQILGSDYINNFRPTWEIQATPTQSRVLEHAWGGFDDAMQIAPFGWPGSQMVCSFSPNNYDQRAGLAHWEISQDQMSAP